MLKTAKKIKVLTKMKSKVRMCSGSVPQKWWTEIGQNAIRAYDLNLHLVRVLGLVGWCVFLGWWLVRVLGLVVGA